MGRGRQSEPSTEALDALEKSLGYAFEDRAGLLRALTHPSYANEFLGKPAENNQRMEFLGDSVLNLAISTALFERFPDRTEGKLSRLRSFLVCEETLAERAAEWNLGACLRLGKGERRSGGNKKASLLADAYEAVLAAIYLDSDFDTARKVIAASFEAVFQEIEGGVHSRDFKTRLQEVIQSRQGDARPRYHIVGTHGPPHDRRFVAEVRVGEDVLGEGDGPTKKAAQQSAARDAMSKLRAERAAP